jgi:hypothetical protein
MYPHLAVLADLIEPFVEDDHVMRLAAADKVLSARKLFLVECVDGVVSVSSPFYVVA